MLSATDTERRIRDLLANAVHQGVFPGGVLRIETGSGASLEMPCGQLARDPGAARVGPDTRYDLASLTKVVATTAIAMRALDRGALDVVTPVAELLPSGAPAWTATVAVHHLLSHGSGLAAWEPYFRQLSEAGVPLGGAEAREWVIERILATGPLDPPGQVARYSDVGFLLLGALLQRALGADLRTLWLREVCVPFGLGKLDYRPLGRVSATELYPEMATDPLIAPTEECPWRGRVLVGEVHDENAWALGGVAPHAGLFATASEVARFGREMLAAWRGRSNLLGQTTARRFARRATRPLGTTWALGWDTPSPGESSAGPTVSRKAIGALGFTGTSLWIDPLRDAVVVLLTNRVHPSRENEAIRGFRPRIHEAAFAWVDATAGERA
jgi:CubicO group peptidase (beta-lactamase class C family)